MRRRYTPTPASRRCSKERAVVARSPRCPMIDVRCRRRDRTAGSMSEEDLPLMRGERPFQLQPPVLRVERDDEAAQHFRADVADPGSRSGPDITELHLLELQH